MSQVVLQAENLTKIYRSAEKELIVLDDISFSAPEMRGQEVAIDAAYVRERLQPILMNEDLSRYIL
mgnify:CR=1 FL=1